MWQPDGRAVDPAVVLDSPPRSACLSSFDGLDRNGTWNLFVADLAAGDVAQLDSRSLTITASDAIPEPSRAAMIGIAIVVVALRRCR